MKKNRKILPSVHALNKRYNELKAVENLPLGINFLDLALRVKITL